MFSSSWRNFVHCLRPAPRQAARRPRAPRLHCEQLEPRLQPSTFNFSTGVPDGKIGTISEPASAHTGQVEYETGDDFVLTNQTKLQSASFTGLLTGGANTEEVNKVVVEIYEVFPNLSDVSRTSGPPTFSTPEVPTRVNSPSDVALTSRSDPSSSSSPELSALGKVLDSNFTVQNSVSSADAISLKSGGDGSVSGEEVRFNVRFTQPLDLAAGHYFFVPQVGLSDSAPEGSAFLWLSAPKPIVRPGTPFPPGFTDLQSWMRDDPTLAPDWLRIGTDIIGGTTFNATFSLSGDIVSPGTSGSGPTSAAQVSHDLTPPASAHNIPSQSLLHSGGQHAMLPSSLAQEGGPGLTVPYAQPGAATAATNTAIAPPSTQGHGPDAVALNQALSFGASGFGSSSASGHLEQSWQHHGSAAVTPPGD
jgi:hypothetical protein